MAESIGESSSEVAAPENNATVPSSVLTCEMCQNYELKLTNMQDSERQMKDEMKAIKLLSERYEVDLANERQYRREAEKKMMELSAETNDLVKDAVKVNVQLEQRLNELTAKHEKAVEVFTEQLNGAHKTIQMTEEKMSAIMERYQDLLGLNRKTANELRAEPIDLPTDIDQLQFMCLTTKEDLIETKAAREHSEQFLKDEIAMLSEQLSEERSTKDALERDLLGQINHLQTELGISNSKLSSASNVLSQSESQHRHIRDLQSTVKELEDQVTQVQNEKAAVQKTAQNYKQRCASLQQELDTSEGVQRDFVKLSQSLQIQLEKIRQSEQEVRWQWDDDVDKCSNCEASVVKLKPKPHCLHCGKIFCVACVKDTVPSGPNQRPSNVCQVCHTLLNRDSKPFFATRDPPSN